MITQNPNIKVGDFKILNARILENYKFSGLELNRYLYTCKQYLYERRTNDEFAKLNAAAQEDCLLQKSILGSNFTEVKGLVDILNKCDDISLTEIYLILNSTALKSGFVEDETFFKIISDMQSPLLAGVESYLSQVLALRSLDKQLTLWASDALTYDVLSFDFEDCENITIKMVDIYDNNHEDVKFKDIFYFPQFRSKRHFPRGAYYGNDAATIAVELLMKNLSEEGCLTAVMPSKVNFSQMEVHFRQFAGNNLMKVTRLADKTLKNTSVKSFLYKFGMKTKLKTIEIFDGIDGDSITVDSKSVRNGDSDCDLFWDFDKVLTPKDEDAFVISNRDCVKLSDISEVLRGKPLSVYATPVVGAANHLDGMSYFSYIDLRAVKKDCIDFSEVQEYELSKSIALPFLQKGDLLIPNKGDISKIVLFDSNIENCIASSNLFVIRPKNRKEISSEYLFMYLRSEVGQKYIKGIHRTANVHIINHEDLKNILVVCPELAKQKEVVKKYNLIKGKYIKQLEELQKNIKQLDKSLSDYICGEIEDFQ